MEEKLRILMQSENLTASRLAEILEVKPASISHILSGRNKPSFELLCKIVNRFPQINPYWLLGDAEEMRNKSVANPTAAPAASYPSGTLFDSREERSDEGANSNIAESSTNLKTLPLGRNDISKIIVIYNDQTFEELRPKRS